MATPFITRQGHFPVPVTRLADMTGLTHLKFSEVSGDKGLRHAAEYFWNAKKLTMSVSGSCDARVWTAIDPEPETPPYYTSEDHTFTFSKTYTAYASDGELDAASVVPDVGGTSPQPAARARGFVEIGGIIEFDYAYRLFANFNGLGGDGLSMSWFPYEIAFSIADDRYVLIMNSTFFSFFGLSGDFSQNISPLLSTTAEPPTPAEDYMSVTPTLPSCFDSSGVAFYSARNYNTDPNPGGATEELAQTYGLTVTLEYWTYP